jgi:hypothetical protein
MLICNLGDAETPHCRLTSWFSGPAGWRQTCACKFDDALLGPLQPLVRPNFVQ